MCRKKMGKMLRMEAFPLKDRAKILKEYQLLEKKYDSFLNITREIGDALQKANYEQILSLLNTRDRLIKQIARLQINVKEYMQQKDINLQDLGVDFNQITVKIKETMKLNQQYGQELAKLQGKLKKDHQRLKDNIKLKNNYEKSNIRSTQIIDRES